MNTYIDRIYRNPIAPYNIGKENILWLDTYSFPYTLKVHYHGKWTPITAIGKSVYLIAVENGFLGTPQLFIASLKGEPGDSSELEGIVLDIKDQIAEMLADPDTDAALVALVAVALLTANSAAASANSATTAASQVGQQVEELAQKVGKIDVKMSGNNLVVTDKEGNTTTTNVKGADGFSPTASVTQTANGATISITDKNGTKSATIDTSAKLEVDSVKDNGNIVLKDGNGNKKEYMAATPSGDPMHYAYVNSGAVYNDSDEKQLYADYQRQFYIEPHRWWLGGVGDMTTEDIRNSYVKSRHLFVSSSSCALRSETSIRAVFPPSGSFSGKGTMSIGAACYGCSKLESLILDNSFFYRSSNAVLIDTLRYSFTNCYMLKNAGYFNVNGITASKDIQFAFLNCYAIEEVYLQNLKIGVSFSESPNLLPTCVAFDINKVATTNNITITLHPTAYANAIADEDVQSALAEHTNVTLVSA